jgi:hypothetical protein
VDDEEKKFLTLPGLELQLQPIANTDYAIPAPIYTFISLKLKKNLYAS